MYGVGQGLNEGVKTASAALLHVGDQAIQQARYSHLDDLYTKENEFRRGRKGLPPAYTEEEQAEQAAATRPEIPSSVPTSTPGPLGIPETRFETGSAVQPMPAAAPVEPMGGAAALLPPSMRLRSLRTLPGMRRRY